MKSFLELVVFSLAFGLIISSPVESSVGDRNGDSTALADDDDDDICSPKIADTCFGDVEDDFRKIFDPANGYAMANNASMLRDICSAWNDSLSCTSDIIDEKCQVADGRVRFDHWNAALRQTFDHVCGENFRLLQDFFHGIKCFNISAFLYCIESTADLKNVQDLMNTDLDVKECWYLKKVVQKCGEYVTLDTCALEVMEPLGIIVDKFFEVGNCEAPSDFAERSGAAGIFQVFSLYFRFVAAALTIFVIIY